MGTLAWIARCSRVAGWVVVATLTTTGCTVNLDPEATPTAAPTAITFGPNDVAVGTLLDRSAEAWQEVEGWTAETRVEQPDPSESGVGGTVIVEEVLLPSTRRVLTTAADMVVAEEIALDDVIYMRGSLVASSIYPEVDADTWISFSPEIAPPDTPLAQRVRYLTSDPGFPLSAVTPETRGLPASPEGEIEVDGRSCSVYAFTSQNESPANITYRIAFDTEWLPCQLVREGGGVVETTTWTFNAEQIAITPPDDAVAVETFPTTP